MYYPYYGELRDAIQNINQGNYGLWYNKFIPLNNYEKCEACGMNKKKETTVELYFSKYNELKKNREIEKILKNKHLDQSTFCEAFSKKYNSIFLSAQLSSLFITGIGETHPHEVSMVFDHNMGIPYIPATGIKGIVRFAHTLGLLYDENGSFTDRFFEKKEGKEFINEENEETFIPHLFGAQEKRGSVIFLDAYPEIVPDLHIDIMNPHYGDYYSDDKNKTPPADYLNPVPIKFLTVAKGTVFLFRALVDKKHSEIVKKVKNAFEKALTAEGVGAKTAVGYGLFDILTDSEGVSGLPETKQQPVAVAQDIKTPLEKLIDELGLIKANDMGRIGTIIQKIDTLETDAEKKEIAKAIRDKIGAKAFKKHKQKEYMLELIAKAKQ